jgi:soluble P-type ATPase
MKVSFDYDGTLSTRDGKLLAKKYITTGTDVYIISARSTKEGMMPTANLLGINADHVFATGSNTEKVNKIKELNIDKHFDNNPDVIKALGNIGSKFFEV